jgi:hypothetical protein
MDYDARTEQWCHIAIAGGAIFGHRYVLLLPGGDNEGINETPTPTTCLIFQLRTRVPNAPGPLACGGLITWFCRPVSGYVRRTILW